ncbi:anti-sigma factor domain-containing protein [Sutcliffiella horikoshii]|uniref:anti-sigma factor domain-containing protein n=1 Tax=Sutcliffiella horikoshii TaxID=79883 RepID=UPI00203D98BB|nr:anti-sigma factor domain-containing protein [Sutcliffiella horikoshii]
MKKGIVLEVHDEHVTILTPEGEFLKSRKQKGQVDLGEEIVFFPLHRAEMKRKGKIGSIFRAKWAVISVLTAIILAFSLYPKYASNQVYAYVSVDVNPSIELGINKDMKVISMDAYNKEGKDIIKQLEGWENKDLTSVSSQIFEIFRDNGYLSENSEVLIASVLMNQKNDGWHSLMQSKITTISEKIQQDKVSITTVETTLQERSDAIKEGMSPGKYIQKEQNTELVDNEDTSKTHVIPTTPLNHKLLDIKQANSDAKDKEFVDSKMVEGQLEDKKGKVERESRKEELKKERKEERKEYKEQRKQEQKERKEHKKKEHTEWKDQRKEEKDKQPNVPRKDEKHNSNQHHQNGKGKSEQKKNDSPKGHHGKEKHKDNRGEAKGKNKQDEKKRHENKKGNN